MCPSLPLGDLDHINSAPLCQIHSWQKLAALPKNPASSWEPRSSRGRPPLPIKPTPLSRVPLNGKYEWKRLYWWFWSRSRVLWHSKAKNFIWRRTLPPTPPSMACVAVWLGYFPWDPKVSSGPNVSPCCSVFSLPPCISSLVFLSSPFTCKVKREFLSMSTAGQFYFILWSFMAKNHPSP